MRKNNNYMFGVLALLVSVVAVGMVYAGFTQTLNINGTGNVVAASWNIYFANLSNAVTTGSANLTTPATISPKTKIGNYAVTFYEPGDSLTYTFDVTNQGDFDAVLTTLTKNTPTCNPSATLCSYLSYTLKYTSGGANVAANDKLLVGQTKNMTLKLMLDSNMPASALPTSTITIGGLGITLLYSQDSGYGGNGGSQIVKPNVNIFSINGLGQQIGDTLVTDNSTVFDNYLDALDAIDDRSSGSPKVFTAHITNGSNVITDSYVGFILNGEDYYLKGYDANAYSDNIDVLNAAFASGSCTLYNAGQANEYYACEGNFHVEIYPDGSVGVRDSCGCGDCSVESSGFSSCFTE